MISIVIGLCAVAVIAVNGECDKTICSEVPRHYQELGCTAITEEGQCCPQKFECPTLEDDGKCHFKTKAYEIGTNIAEEDQPECLVSCRCTKSFSTNKPRIECVFVECPQLFNAPDPECINVHQHGRCCPKTVCDKDEIAKYKETICHFEGKQYHEGAKIYPDNEEATCICAKNFNNATVVDNRHCKALDCSILIHYSDKLHQGCAPVYYGKSTGCPIEWICPSDEDTLMQEDTDEPMTKNEVATPACTFGKLAFGLDDKLKTEKSCVKCSCSVPPMIHCIQEGHC